MTRYYFDTYDGSTWCTDDEGQKHPTEQQALKLAYEALADLAKDEVPKGKDCSLIVRLRAGLARLINQPTGQGLAEYALILALIAIIAIIALIFLGNQVSSILSTVGNSV